MAKRTDHATKQVKGSIKEAIGMLIGDPAVQAEGAAEKAGEAEQSSDIGAPDPKAAPST
ncbi:CsbD family protein [Sphingomonas sp. STIS6.2]|uniref:CsbD family protein n=1 Tax=Sphingomonas sp. STIS6.2 TaxID=1379700 RepID=UPI000A862CF2|nr:CsbD family protein [Sphingomonas sp. STIS6.2]